MKVGVLGGGQLGQMLALAGIPLNFRFRFFDPSPLAPAGVAGDLVVARYDDLDALHRFADGLDLLTYEFENVPLEVVTMLARRVPVFPPANALAIAQDRLLEKQCFVHLGIPTAPFIAAGNAGQVAEAARALTLPVVLKTRRMGYDGQGQAIIRSFDAVAEAWQAVGAVDSIVEKLIDFDRELSILSVRSGAGHVAHYPLVENHHRAGILRRSIAPAPNVPDAVRAHAESYARQVLDSLDYVGVLAIELFQCGADLLANEMAPRVHNSGHWTLEGAATSQFENHLRAVAGLPLGAVDATGFSALDNVIGSTPPLSTLLGTPGAHVHLYGKADRPGRKLGHFTIVAPTREALEDSVRRLPPLGD